VDVEKLLQDMGLDYEEDDKRFKICCPFHDDSSPSCGVWKDSGYFHCWGCQEEGSMVDLLMEVEGISKGEAIRRTRGEDDISDMEDRIRNILGNDPKEFRYLSKKSFHKVYPPVKLGSPFCRYLMGPSRKLNMSTILRFDAREGNLKYRNRVVLPIYGVDGKLISYVGRAIDDRQPKTRKARSPHRTFFGLFELLRDFVPDSFSGLIILVEGEFDAMYLQQLGVPAVANMGTGDLGPEKIQLLRKYSRKVVLSYDPDDAGERATYGYTTKSGRFHPGHIQVLRKHLPVEVVELPGKDPNDLTPEEVRDVYKQFCSVADGEG